MSHSEHSSPPAGPGTGLSELVIEGGETADHTVPADVLLRSLEHLQRIVYLLAAADEKRPIQERLALPEAFRRRHGLRCGVPRASSYAVPLSLNSFESLPGTDGGPSLHRTFEVLRSAAEGAWEELAGMVPDPRYRSRVLGELQGMLPRPGDRWGIAFQTGNDRIALTAQTYRLVQRYNSPEVLEDTVMTITGELVRVDIDKRKVVIRYRPTGQEIPCYCEESALQSVLENWTAPIQVTGRFILDRTGHPTRLTGVTRVEPVDLSPLSFDRLEWAGRRLLLDPPLRLEPTLDDESGQLYLLEAPELGVDVFARTREEVVDELAEQMLFQWDTYASERPDKLTAGARYLREALLARVREESVATQSERS